MGSSEAHENDRSTAWSKQAPMDRILDGHARGPRDATKRSETTENIFLFYPNLIGNISLRVLVRCAPLREMESLWGTLRLFSNRTRGGFPSLHAPSSPHLLAPLQHLLSPRCLGWSGGTTLQPSHPFRRGSRYGHGSMHHRLSLSLPQFRVASMGPLVPRLDQS